METSLEVMDRWSFLTPLCERLRGRLSKNRWPDDTAAIKLALPTRAEYSDELSFRHYFNSIREAAALLAAVARVDGEAWRCLVDWCITGFRIEGEHFPVRFILHVDLKGHDGEYDLVRFCGAHQNDDTSREYQQALARVAAMAGNAFRPGEIKIPVLARWGKRDHDDAGLTGAYTAERIIREEWETVGPSLKQEVESLRCTFVLEPMVVDLPHLNANISKALDTLMRNNTRLSLLGLEVDSMSVTESLSGERPSRKLFGDTLTSVLGIRRASEVADTAENPVSSQVDKVNLFTRDWEVRPYDLAVISTAIVVSQTTKKLSLRLDRIIDTTQWWKCMAYALFSERARMYSSVDSLSMSMLRSLSLADVEGFSSMLASQRPEEDLFGFPHGEIKGQCATLKPNSPVRWPLKIQDQRRRRKWKALVFDDPIPFIKTFSDDGVSSWVNILLPGYGPGRVQRENLIFHEENSTRGPQELSSLTISFRRDGQSNSDGLPAFLARIGRSLKHLAIHKDYQEVDELQILPNCPNLESLVLGWGVVDTRFDFREYQAAKQPLPALKTNWYDVSAVASDLSDVTSPLAKCVRRLRIRLLVPSDDSSLPRSDKALELLLEMLQRNRTLEYVEVVAPLEQERYISDFKEQHLKPIWSIKTPLSVECKLAFMSMLSRGKMASEKRRMEPQHSFSPPELSEVVLSTIFDFAAEPALREVYLHILDQSLIYVIAGGSDFDL